MKLEAIKDHIDWNNITSSNADSLFFKFEWYNLFKTPWKSNVLLKFGDCYLPLQLNLFNRNAYSGPWGSYGGPIGDVNLVEDLLAAAKRKLFIRKTVLYCERELSLKKLKFQVVKNTAVVVYLDDLEVILKRLKENRKRNLKKALGGNFYFEMLKGMEGVTRYIELLKRVHKGMHKYSFHEIGVFKNLGKLKEAIFCFAGREKDESGAVIIELKSDTIFYWHGVNSAEALNLRIGDFLHWSIIGYGLKNGFKFYNLGTSPHIELLNYKLSWGGEEKTIYTYWI